MIYTEVGEIKYFSFNIFDNTISQAIFSRRGGVSPQPWASLNMGGTVGDHAVRVLENKNRALAILGTRIESVFDVWQVHGNKVTISRKPRLPNSEHIQADAILTDQRGLTLMMRFADCVPVFIFDPIHNVVGIAHAGWLGIVNGVISSTIKAMKDQYGTDPKNILSGIGPSIGPDHYQIGDDVAKRVDSTFGNDSTELLKVINGHMYLDLWTSVQIQLESFGIKHIENSRLCTACHIDDWFSHRAEHGQTGRFGAFISLI